MRVKIAKPVNLAIDPSAAADLEAALALKGKSLVGFIDGKALLSEFVRVIAHDTVSQSANFRLGGVRWTCCAALEFYAVSYAPGEVYLLTCETSERSIFSNSLCSANLLSPELASKYRPGDLVPMIVVTCNGFRGQTQFSATVRPWTASEARLPLFSLGAVSPAETVDFPDLADSLDAAVARAHDASAARKALGIDAPPLPGASSLSSLLRSLHANPSARPLESLAVSPGSGLASRAVVADSAAAGDSPLRRPAIALAEAAYRELSLLSVLAELTELHPARLRKGSQDIVWQIAARSRLA